MAAMSLFNKLHKLICLRRAMKESWPCLNILKYKGCITSNVVSRSIVSKATNWHYSTNLIQGYCSAANDIPIVSYEYVKQLSKRPEILLIDVREPHELQDTGKIPTSVNIPLGKVAEELGPSTDNDAFKAKYGRNKPERNTEIIFHCKIGKRSQNAAELARTLGYQNTKNYLGSWTEWAEKENLPK